MKESLKQYLQEIEKRENQSTTEETAKAEEVVEQSDNESEKGKKD